MSSERADSTQAAGAALAFGGMAVASPTEPDELRALFARDGVVLVRGAFDPDRAAAMRQRFWRYVEQHSEIREHDPASWPAGRGGLSVRGLRRDPVFGTFHSGPCIDRALDAVFGAGAWTAPGLGSQLLFTFPTPPPWVLPARTWHIDSGFERPTAPVRTVKLFGLMDDVEPTGGGTLMLAGSPRLVDACAELLPTGTGGNRETWGRFMSQHPHLRRLHCGGSVDAPGRDLLGAEIDVAGVPMRAVEVTGDAGDVVIAHLQTFHGIAPNTTSRPRLMLGKTVTRSG
jgi:hypothetical protein